MPRRPATRAERSFPYATSAMSRLCPSSTTAWSRTALAASVANPSPPRRSHERVPDLELVVPLDLPVGEAAPPEERSRLPIEHGQMAVPLEREGLHAPRKPRGGLIRRLDPADPFRHLRVGVQARKAIQILRAHRAKSEPFGLDHALHTSTLSKNSPPRRPVRRFTWRVRRSSRLRPARSRICG